MISIPFRADCQKGADPIAAKSSSNGPTFHRKMSLSWGVGQECKNRKNGLDGLDLWVSGGFDP
jgi:hypothetical protein